VRQIAVALPRVTRGADFWGRLLFPLLYTLSDYAIDTDSLRNPGTAQLLRFRILEDSLLAAHSSAANLTYSPRCPVASEPPRRPRRRRE
jgi:hypothetical protein